MENAEDWLNAASMEPCLFRHGKIVGLLPYRDHKDKLQWSHVFSDMVRFWRSERARVAGVASMEPCLFRHGKAGTASPHSAQRLASMEPCLFRHGKGIFTLVGRGAGQASMEPCLFRHGKT